jgi:hypothetical protein
MDGIWRLAGRVQGIADRQNNQGCDSFSSQISALSKPSGNNGRIIRNVGEDFGAHTPPGRPLRRRAPIGRRHLNPGSRPEIDEVAAEHGAVFLGDPTPKKSG